MGSDVGCFHDSFLWLTSDQFKALFTRWLNKQNSYQIYSFKRHNYHTASSSISHRNFQPVSAMNGLHIFDSSTLFFSYFVFRIVVVTRMIDAWTARLHDKYTSMSHMHVRVKATWTWHLAYGLRTIWNAMKYSLSEKRQERQIDIRSPTDSSFLFQANIELIMKTVACCWCQWKRTVSWMARCFPCSGCREPSSFLWAVVTLYRCLLPDVL
jgi:hypothetical protein